MTNTENFAGFMVPRADFKPEAFDTLISQKGYRVIWQQGMFCSCYDGTSGQPHYGCPTCKGKGYIYFGDEETRVIVTSINGTKEQGKIGLDEVGSAYLTPLSTDNVGFRDRFIFQDFVMKYSQVVEYSEGVNMMRYPVMDMVAVRHLNTHYRRGIDFELSRDGTELTWTIPPTMKDGDRYSVLYTTRPVYIAINPVHELRGTYTMHKGKGLERFVQLPKQFQIKREDFIESGTAY